MLLIRSFTKGIPQRLRPVFPSNLLTAITCRLKNRRHPPNISMRLF